MPNYVPNGAPLWTPNRTREVAPGTVVAGTTVETDVGLKTLPKFIASPLCDPGTANNLVLSNAIAAHPAGSVVSMPAYTIPLRFHYLGPCVP
jgi:hypothetical protein